MLDIGKNNLFLTDDYESDDFPGLSVYGGHYIISNIINYYDDMGKNCLYLYIDNTTMNLSTSGCNCIKYNNNEDLRIKLYNNLFRVDIIIVDANNDIYKNISLIESIRSITDLPYILIGEKSYHFTSVNDFDYVYSFYKKNNVNTQPWNITNISINSSKLSYVVDIKNNNTMTLEEIKLRYIRNIKIDNLFNDE